MLHTNKPAPRRDVPVMRVLDLFAGAGGFTIACEMVVGCDRMIHGF